MNVQNKTQQQLNTTNFKGIYFTKCWPIASKHKYRVPAIDEQAKVVGNLKYVEDNWVYPAIKDAFMNNPFFKKLGETGDIFVQSVEKDAICSFKKYGQKEKASILTFFHLDKNKKSVGAYQSIEFGYGLNKAVEKHAKIISNIKNEEELSALDWRRNIAT